MAKVLVAKGRFSCIDQSKMPFGSLYNKQMLTRNGEGKMEKCYKLIFLLEYIKISYHILAYPLGLVSLFPHYLIRSVTIFPYHDLFP